MWVFVYASHKPEAAEETLRWPRRRSRKTNSPWPKKGSSCSIQEEEAAQKELEKEAKEAAAEKAVVELLQRRKGAAQGQR
jgi:hypothetical protein